MSISALPNPLSLNFYSSICCCSIFRGTTNVQSAHSTSCQYEWQHLHLSPWHSCTKHIALRLPAIHQAVHEENINLQCMAHSRCMLWSECFQEVTLGWRAPSFILVKTWNSEEYVMDEFERFTSKIMVLLDTNRTTKCKSDFVVYELKKC